MSRYSISRLPSGYWCVRFDGKWIEASLPTKEAAEKYVKDAEKYFSDEFKKVVRPMGYNINYISKVKKTDERYHRSEIIIHKGNGYYLAEFRDQEQLDEFARMIGFEYRKRKEEEGKPFGLYQEYDIDRRFVDGAMFWKIDDLPENAKPFLGLSNGSIVTCYFTNDGETVTIYRPNPNAKEVYHPLPLEKHIAYHMLHGVY